ncbi:mucin-5AC-like [Colossoma macropomum]|uniref:mucin-5AC-like n=1 Tax=Colossoma macropomum TaxID=42526 RepID=UPI001864A570|nr:mucin-5AC-like [Colossoma macropomum]
MMMKTVMKAVFLGCVWVSVWPTWCVCFSRGANSASCVDMKPGHISAQPQHIHIQSAVTVHTSRTIYLPQQTLMVSVRSSRAFMGLLLQARSVPEDRVVGGEFTLNPPGTHTLSCISTADTVTHSDKLLKRNLSFTWRAPAQPSGDMRFYITVVHSYFVYWSRIRSAVVHDGTRRSAGYDGGLQTRIISASLLKPKDTQTHTSSALHLLNSAPSSAIYTNKSSPNTTRLTFTFIHCNIHNLKLKPPLNPNLNYNINFNLNFNPKFNHNLNPSLNLNPNLNPNLNTNPSLNLNPNLNSTLNTNPSLNLNPNLNPSLNTNPSFNLNPNLNPNLNTNPSLNPNPNLNPNLNTNPSLNLNPNLNPNLNTNPTSILIPTSNPLSTPTLASILIPNSTPISGQHPASILIPSSTPASILVLTSNPLSTPTPPSIPTDLNQILIPTTNLTIIPIPTLTSNSILVPTPTSISPTPPIISILTPTPIPNSTLIPISISSSIPTPTSISTLMPTKTSILTLSETATPTSIPYFTLIPTPMPVLTSIPTPSSTAIPIQTLKSIPTHMLTPTPLHTSTLPSSPHPDPSPALQRSLSNPLPPRESRDESDSHAQREEGSSEPKPPQRPRGPPRAPDGKGEKPELVPRQNASELGLLLVGVSAGLGMAAAVGLRYLQRKHCRRHTAVSLGDRSHGNRGVIHVQECGDLVQVRRIRENSFLLLQAEYNLITAPGS